MKEYVEFEKLVFKELVRKFSDMKVECSLEGKERKEERVGREGERVGRERGKEGERQSERLRARGPDVMLCPMSTG